MAGEFIFSLQDARLVADEGDKLSKGDEGFAYF